MPRYWRIRLKAGVLNENEKRAAMKGEKMLLICFGICIVLASLKGV